MAGRGGDFGRMREDASEEAVNGIVALCLSMSFQPGGSSCVASGAIRESPLGEYE